MSAGQAPRLRQRASRLLETANIFSIPAGVPFAPTLARALIDGALIAGFPGAGGPLDARRRDDLRADPTRRRGVGAGARRGERRGEPDPAAHRPARRLRAEPRRARPARRRRVRRGKGPGGGRRTRAANDARAAHARLGPGAQRRDPRRRRRRAAHVRRGRAAAGGDEPGAGLRARRRPRRPDRRLHHRGRRPGAARTTSSPTASIPIGASPSTSSRSPSPIGPTGSPSAASSTARAAPRWRSTAKSARSPPAPKRGPTIVAGSTGANSATARLMAAVARAPQGAVVLPDLDRDLDDAAWALLGDPDGDAVGVAGHPQAILLSAAGDRRRRPRRSAPARRS